MLFIKIIRKIGKLLRGGAGTREIFLGGFLGFLLGMVPGANLSALLLIVLLLVLNANFGVVVPSLALGKLVCLLLAPATCWLGRLAVHLPGVESVVAMAANAPVVALLDLHVYCVTGGLLLGGVLAVCFGWAAVRALTSMRQALAQAGEKSERLRKIAEHKTMQLFLRIVFGKVKPSKDDEEEKKEPLFRRGGVVAACVVVVLFGVVELLFLDSIAARALERGLALSTGAEVNVEDMDMSLAAGVLSVGHIAATDPDEPERNLFEAEMIRADLSVSSLLAKRVVVDLVKMGKIQMHTTRDKPGRVYRQDRPQTVPEDEGGSWENRRVDEILAQGQKVRTWLNRLREYLGRQEKTAPDGEGGDVGGQEEDSGLARNRRYFEQSALSMVAKRPTWVIRKLEVDSLPLAGLAGQHRVEGESLTSHPALLGQPMSVRLVEGADAPPTLLLTFDFSAPGARHDLGLDLRKVDLSKVGALSSKLPFVVEKGMADITAEGQFSSDSIDIPFTVKASGLSVQSREGKQAFGLDAESARAMLAGLRTLDITGGVGGSLAAPRLRIEKGALTELAKQAAKEAAKGKVRAEAGKAIDKIDVKGADALKSKLKGFLSGDK